MNLTLHDSGPEDLKETEALCSYVFGPGCFAKTAFRIREAYRSRGDFGLCIRAGDGLIGSITFTPILVGGERGAFLLGPLAVHPSFAGQGCGVCLVEEGVKRAAERGGELVVLVGDLSYYGRMGFSPAPEGQLVFPGPVNSSRILVRALTDDALNRFRGNIQAEA